MNQRSPTMPIAERRNTVETQDIPWSYLLIVLFCGAVLATGFFFAARQHFTSMDLGIKNSKLRKQVEDLEAEKRRLQLAKEVALSPFEIRKASRGVVARNSTQTNSAELAAQAPQNEKITGDVIVKTASVKPSAVVGAIHASFIEPVAKPLSKKAEKPAVSNERKEKLEVASLGKFK